MGWVTKDTLLGLSNGVGREKRGIIRTEEEKGER